MPGYSLIVFSISPSSIRSPLYLHLVILPTQIFDVPVGQPPRDVSGSIDSFTGIDGIVGEFFIGQGRVVQVASGQADPGDAQLPGLPDRHLLAVSG